MNSTTGTIRATGWKEGTVKKREGKKVPGGQPKKAWAGRFRQDTAPEVERFTESISFDRRLYRQDILGSIAHARMLAHQGILPAPGTTKTT